MNFNILCNLVLWYFAGIFYFSTFLSGPNNDNKKNARKNYLQFSFVRQLFY
jgi:Na+/phosphate symporter